MSILAGTPQVMGKLFPETSFHFVSHTFFFFLLSELKISLNEASIHFSYPIPEYHME